MRHFLSTEDWSRSDLQSIIDRARELRSSPMGDALKGKSVALMFFNPSLRTRTSFQLGVQQLGGFAIVLDAQGQTWPVEFEDGAIMDAGPEEHIKEAARVLSRYVDIIMLRTDDHAKMVELAEHATVPVINGLSDAGHPCQLMADILTFEEHRGPIAGKRVAWVGDGNNMARSWIEATHRFDFELMLACPPELSPPSQCIEEAIAAGGKVRLVHDADAGVEGVDAVVADTWVSMGDEEAERRHNLLMPYQVTEKLMARANKDAIFLHCLPAHRGEEMTAGVIDGPQSVVFDEAENRLHAQKGILAWCLD